MKSGELAREIALARERWHREHNSQCTMCDAADVPHAGLHRGRWPCMNGCLLCAGAREYGTCRACGRTGGQG